MTKRKYPHIGKYATKIDVGLAKTLVTYHDTPVVTIEPDRIILNTGGWFTFSTKNKMNEVSRQFNLGYYVFQRNYMWYVEYKGKIIPFESNVLVLKR